MRREMAGLGSRREQGVGVTERSCSTSTAPRCQTCLRGNRRSICPAGFLRSMAHVDAKGGRGGGGEGGDREPYLARL